MKMLYSKSDARYTIQTTIVIGHTMPKSMARNASPMLKRSQLLNLVRMMVADMMATTSAMIAYINMIVVLMTISVLLHFIELRFKNVQFLQLSFQPRNPSILSHNCFPEPSILPSNDSYSSPDVHFSFSLSSTNFHISFFNSRYVLGVDNTSDISSNGFLHVRSFCPILAQLAIVPCPRS